MENGKKKKGGKECTLSCTHETRLRRIRLAPDAANPLSMCRAKVKEIQKCSSAPITSEFRPDENNQWQHQSWREEQTKPIDWLDTHRGKRKSGSSNNHPAHQPQPIIAALLVIEANHNHTFPSNSREINVAAKTITAT